MTRLNDESYPTYRYADRTISSRFKLTTSGYKCLNSAWRVVSEGSLHTTLQRRAFPADCPHRWIVTELTSRNRSIRVPADTPEFPAYSQVYLRNYVSP